MQRLIAACSLLYLAVTAPAGAETRGLLVGINDYASQPRLLGAVNDVDDMEKTLRNAQVSDITVLREETATREALLAGWQAMLDRAKAGDTLIVHFAGHGTKVADAAPLDEEDGSDEAFLLQAFDEDDRFGEKLSDDEIHQWGLDAEAKGVNIFFVFDTCHSGGLMRSGDFRISGSSSRLTELKTRPKKRQNIDLSAVKPIALGPNVALITATGENQKVEEHFINGQRRGVLSLVFADALRGMADSNQDGAVSTAEIAGYVPAMIQSRSQNSQNPQMTFPAQPFAVVGSTTPHAAGQVERQPEASIRLALRPAGGNETWQGAVAEEDEAKADLIWDSEEGRILSQQGEILSLARDPREVQAAIDAYRTGRAVIDLMGMGHVLEVKLSDGDGMYCERQAFNISSSPASFPHYTAVDLTASGEAQFLYPWPGMKGHDLVWTNDEPWWFRAQVQPPFGSELVILVASERPLLNLHGAFSAKGGVMEPLEFLGILVQELRSMKYEIGMTRIFTKARSSETDTECPIL